MVVHSTSGESVAQDLPSHSKRVFAFGSLPLSIGYVSLLDQRSMGQRNCWILGNNRGEALELADGEWVGCLRLLTDVQ